MLIEWNLALQVLTWLAAVTVAMLALASYRILRRQYGGRDGNGSQEHLSTPIEAVLRMVELTLNTELTATQRAYLETGLSAAQLVKLELFEARSVSGDSPIRH